MWKRLANLSINEKLKLFSILLAKPRAKQRVGKEIGKEAAEKSKGLFAAEDWVCTKYYF